MKIERPPSRQPLPDDAKKVFDGVIFDVYQWQQKQFDGTFATFEKLKRKDTVMVIAITQDNKFLLLEQHQPGKPPFLGLAGGRADTYDEDPFEVGKRELLEETGMVSDDWDVFDAQQPFSKIEWAVYVLIARNCKNVKAQNLDAGEKIQIKEVDFDEFVDVALSDKFADQELTMKLAFAKLDNEMDNLKSRIYGYK